MVEERNTLRIEVVRSDHLGIPPRIPKPDRTTLEHRDVPDALVFGEIICGGQTVTTPADDDDLVSGCRLGVPPGGPPASITAHRLPGKVEKGISSHPDSLRRECRELTLCPKPLGPANNERVKRD